MYDLYYKYYLIFIFFVTLTLFSLGLIIIGKIIARFRGIQQSNIVKNAAFECGFSEPHQKNFRSKFHVHFYMVGLLFLLFDLELIFIIPWAILLSNKQIVLSWSAFNAMILFLLILLIGFIYEWKTGALEWE